MSKKTIYILISVTLIIVLLGLLGYYYYTKDETPEGEGRTNIFRNFFPFGGNENNNNENELGENPFEETPTTPENPVDFTQKLRKISAEPVAGVGIIDVKAGTVIRYIEKATGHIYEVELFSPRQGRISNTTLPKVYKAFWGNKNNSLVAQYIRDESMVVDSYYLNIKDISTTTENTISGVIFPETTEEISVFDTNVFYLEEDLGSSHGYISNFTGGNKKQVWNSPIKELNSQYVNSNTVALTTKPHELHPGYLYFVNTSNGSSRKILGDIFGLSTLVNPSATEVLYFDQGNGLGINVYNIQNRTTIGVTPTTFPEKCAWSKTNTKIIYCAVPKDFITINSLTNWYKGFYSSVDDVWKYDTENNTSEIISDLSKESSENIDLINPMLSEGEQYLVFMNKKDNSLWSLDLTKE